MKNRLHGPFISRIAWDWNSQEDNNKPLGSNISCISKLGCNQQANLNAIFTEACSDIVENSSSSNNPLNKILVKYGCNKGTTHNYPSFYHALFKSVAYEVSVIVELGIGSPYQDGGWSRMRPDYPFGSSLRGWSEYFQNADVIGLDIDPRVLINDGRITSFYLDQLNPCSFLRLTSKLDSLGYADIILDDGLHEHRASIVSLIMLWPYLRSGGVYMIEDVGEEDFYRNLEFLKSLNLHCAIYGIELQSDIKEDNRIIALFKD